MQDGTPCVVFNERLDGPVVEIELSADDYILTMVYEVEPEEEGDDPFKTYTGAQKISKIARKQGTRKERIPSTYPLDRRFFNLLNRVRACAVGSVVDKKMETLRIVPVKITNT